MREIRATLFTTNFFDKNKDILNVISNVLDYEKSTKFTHNHRSKRRIPHNTIHVAKMK